MWALIGFQVERSIRADMISRISGLSAETGRFNYGVPFGTKLLPNIGARVFFE